ncbi:MAG: hypothetical protein O7G30_17820 [Proteobacteria bacterium]|nr:hypothetical protein [Pseudomonadota bacterium]
MRRVVLACAALLAATPVYAEGEVLDVTLTTRVWCDGIDADPEVETGTIAFGSDTVSVPDLQAMPGFPIIGITIKADVTVDELHRDKRAKGRSYSFSADGERCFAITEFTAVNPDLVP